MPASRDHTGEMNGSVCPQAVTVPARQAVLLYLTIFRHDFSHCYPLSGSPICRTIPSAAEEKCREPTAPRPSFSASRSASPASGPWPGSGSDPCCRSPLRKPGPSYRAVLDAGAAMRLDPSGPSIGRGDADVNEERQQRHEESVADYTEANRREPDEAGHYLERANARYRLGRFDEALADYDETIRPRRNHRPTVNRISGRDRTGPRLAQAAGGGGSDYRTTSSLRRSLPPAPRQAGVAICVVVPLAPLCAGTSAGSLCSGSGRKL